MRPAGQAAADPERLLAVLRHFSAATSRGSDRPGLGALLVAAARSLGFHYVALVDHGGADGEDRLRLTNYPSSWQQRWLAGRYGLNDPVQRACRLTGCGFRWSRLDQLIHLTPSQRAVLDESRRHGLGDGFTVPLHRPGWRTKSCSFAVEPDTAFPTAALWAAELLAHRAGERARALDGAASTALPGLSPRQRACIALLGAGLTDGGIARRLGLAEETVTKYLNAARRRYGVSRRSQLLAAALRDGVIGFEDLDLD